MSEMIRFATYNIGCGARGWHARDLPGLAKAIQDHKIDVCAVQEVDRFASRSNFVDFATKLPEMLGFRNVYAESIRFPKEDGLNPRSYGNMILSRWPILHSVELRFENCPVRADAVPAERETRTAIVAEIDGPWKFWAACTHLAYSQDLRPSLTRAHQIEHLVNGLSMVVPPGGPLVLGGDFNTSASSKEMKLLRDRFEMQTDGIGPTWPLDRNDDLRYKPYVDIDHILTAGIEVHGVSSIPLRELTDHCLVHADISPA